MKVKVGYGQDWRCRMKARTCSLVGAVYFGVVLASASLAHAADPPPVAVGEVGTRVSSGNVDLPKALRGVLEREIATLALRQAPRSKRFVLSASLVKLERLQDTGAVSCTVSVVLREQKSGAIRAILEGRARATLQGNDDESMALEAAARAAIASLPEAVR
jgi:hypothetical protein